ncbi:ATPase [Duncaniella muris]|uniref:ATPase n=1 Tax=Duncaniella muris TaxID=2094150 RepID=UPI00271545C8|nr:ATPase [Duncaniella muris]
MTVIADAGSTKIEWALLGKDSRCRLRLCTRGFNAAQSHTDRLVEIIREDAPALLGDATGCSAIYFYGAGCIGERCDEVGSVLKATFAAETAHVDSDMLAAARALCGSEPGIACILGTGSNSCLYDGRRITANTPPMGFILGDEGSGASLGKALLTGIFKRRLPQSVISLFTNRYPEADKAEVIRNVYRGERPAAYLASFAPFLKEHIDLPEISRLVTDEFTRFFSMNILDYDNARALPVHFIGSIAHHFAPQLRRAAADCGLTIGRITQAPMDALISFHGQ